MVNKSTVSNTSGSSSQEGNTVTYLFLASRLFTAKEGGNVKQMKMEIKHKVINRR